LCFLYDSRKKGKQEFLVPTGADYERRRTFRDILWKGTVVRTYGLLIWKNLIFSRVLAISQGGFGLTAKMGG